MFIPPRWKTLNETVVYTIIFKLPGLIFDKLLDKIVNENDFKHIDIIREKIHTFRGQRVMLDFDLAELYQVDTKMLKRAVRRNLKRFPEDFMFELTPDEYLSLRYQFGTLKRGQHSKYLPFVFTEHGVTMLASILNSERGIEMNIAIVRAFISLRQIALEHKDLAGKLDQLRQELYLRLNEHDTQLSAIYEAIENLLDEKIEKQNWEVRERIGFK
jgi:phage regulator Rha-like protein